MTQSFPFVCFYEHCHFEKISFRAHKLVQGLFLNLEALVDNINHKVITCTLKIIYACKYMYVYLLKKSLANSSKTQQTEEATY